MVEPIVHYLIPMLILLAFLPGVDKKLILILSLLAIIPDIDFLLGHRYLLHNLIFVAGIPFLIYILRKETLPSLLALYFLGSHLILDTFGPGIGIFYPFYGRLFRFDFFIYTSPATGTLSYDTNVMTQALVEATKDQLSPAVTSFGVVFIVLVLTAAILKKMIAKEDL